MDYMHPPDYQKVGGQEPILAVCPKCGYSLFGLPDRHRCPECGCDFDRRAKVFKGPSLMIWLVMMVANGIMLLVCILLYVLRMGEPATTGFLIAFVMMFVGAIWRARSHGTLILVSQQHLQIISRNKMQRFLIGDIENIALDPVAGGIRVTKRGGGLLVQIPRNFLSSNRKAKAVINEVIIQIRKGVINQEKERGRTSK